jgi:hypothetical protein
MNERIQKLAEQAGILIDWGEDIKVGRWGIGGKYENMQKFAESIVRECANQVDWILAEGGKTQGDLIKQHFGVKE